jgi:hypothetical protein
MKDETFTSRSAVLFWDKVGDHAPHECLEWLGQRNKRNYGIVSRRGRRMLAHRFAFMLAKGAVGDDEVVRHKCDNPPCCNPAHLEIGSQADNLADMRNRGRDARGEKHPRAKLTQAQADLLRGEYSSGGVSMLQLAKRYGVGTRCVHAIVHHRRYRP